MPDNKYTVEQIGQAAKAKFPKEYGNMDDKTAGMTVISKNPSLQSVATDYSAPEQSDTPSGKSYTLEQFGKAAKIQYPAVYGDMVDSTAGKEFLKKNPAASQYLKKKEPSGQPSGFPLPSSSTTSQDVSTPLVNTPLNPNVPQEKNPAAQLNAVTPQELPSISVSAPEQPKQPKSTIDLSTGDALTNADTQYPVLPKSQQQEMQKRRAELVNTLPQNPNNQQAINAIDDSLKTYSPIGQAAYSDMKKMVGNNPDWFLSPQAQQQTKDEMVQKFGQENLPAINNAIDFFNATNKRKVFLDAGQQMEKQEGVTPQQVDSEYQAQTQDIFNDKEAQAERWYAVLKQQHQSSTPDQQIINKATGELNSLGFNASWWNKYRSGYRIVKNNETPSGYDNLVNNLINHYTQKSLPELQNVAKQNYTIYKYVVAKYNQLHPVAKQINNNKLNELSGLGQQQPVTVNKASSEYAPTVKEQQQVLNPTDTNYPVQSQHYEQQYNTLTKDGGDLEQAKANFEASVRALHIKQGNVLPQGESGLKQQKNAPADNIPDVSAQAESLIKDYDAEMSKVQKQPIVKGGTLPQTTIKAVPSTAYWANLVENLPQDWAKNIDLNTQKFIMALSNQSREDIISGAVLGSPTINNVAPANYKKAVQEYQAQQKAIRKAGESRTQWAKKASLKQLGAAAEYSNPPVALISQKYVSGQLGEMQTQAYQETGMPSPKAVQEAEINKDADTLSKLSSYATLLEGRLKESGNPNEKQDAEQYAKVLMAYKSLLPKYEDEIKDYKGKIKQFPYYVSYKDVNFLAKETHLPVGFFDTLNNSVIGKGVMAITFGNPDYNNYDPSGAVKTFHALMGLVVDAPTFFVGGELADGITDAALKGLSKIKMTEGLASDINAFSDAVTTLMKSGMSSSDAVAGAVEEFPREASRIKAALSVLDATKQGITLGAYNTLYSTAEEIQGIKNATVGLKVNIKGKLQTITHSDGDTVSLVDEDGKKSQMSRKEYNNEVKFSFEPVGKATAVGLVGGAMMPVAQVFSESVMRAAGITKALPNSIANITAQSVSFAIASSYINKGKAPDLKDLENSLVFLTGLKLGGKVREVFGGENPFAKYKLEQEQVNNKTIIDNAVKLEKAIVKDPQFLNKIQDAVVTHNADVATKNIMDRVTTPDKHVIVATKTETVKDERGNDVQKEKQVFIVHGAKVDKNGKVNMEKGQDVVTTSFNKETNRWENSLENPESLKDLNATKDEDFKKDLHKEIINNQNEAIGRMQKPSEATSTEKGMEAPKESKVPSEGVKTTETTKQEIKPIEGITDKTGLVLFHGSPHSFENFDISKLGTGEGAQAFGSGLYFTNKEEIAQGYANKLGSRKNFWNALENGNELSLSREDFNFIKDDLDALGYDGSMAENSDVGELIVDGKQEYSPEVLDAMSVLFGKNAKSELENYGLSESEINRLLDIKKKISDPQLYRVVVHEGKSPSEYDYIDWNEKLTESQINKIGKKLPEGVTGKEAYSIISKELGGDKKASEYLLSKGIDGVTYKSEKGTGGKEGTGRNYVVFDPKSIRIDEINKQKQQPLKTQEDAIKERKIKESSQQQYKGAGGHMETVGKDRNIPPEEQKTGGEAGRGDIPVESGKKQQAQAKEKTLTGTEAAPKAEAPILPKDVRAKRIEYLNEEIGNELGNLMESLGIKKSLTGEQRAKLLPTVEKIVKSVAEKELLRGQNLVDAVVDYLKNVKLPIDVQLRKSIEDKVDRDYPEVVKEPKPSETEMSKTGGINKLVQAAKNVAKTWVRGGGEMDTQEAINIGRMKLDGMTTEQKTAFFDDLKNRINVENPYESQTSSMDLFVSRARAAELENEMNNLHYQADNATGLEKRELNKKWIQAMQKWQNFFGDYVNPLLNKWHREGKGMQGEEDLEDGSLSEYSRRQMKVNKRPFTAEEAEEINRIAFEGYKRVKRAEEIFQKIVERGPVEKETNPISVSLNDLADKIDAARKKIFPSGTLMAATPIVPVVDIGMRTASGILRGAAKGVDLAVTLRDAIEKGIMTMRNSDLYKKLSTTDAENAESRFKTMMREIFTDNGAQSKSKEEIKAEVKGKNTFTAKEANDIWQYMKENFINTHDSPTWTEGEYQTVLKATGDDLGMTPDQVEKAVTTKKTEINLTDEQKSKQDAQRKFMSMAKRMQGLKELPDLRTAFANKKGNDFTMKERLRIWNHTKENYTDKGILNPGEVIKGVANDTGLTTEQVMDGVFARKFSDKKMTDELWKLSTERRRLRETARNMIDYADQPMMLKVAKKLPNVFFSMKVLWHGTVSMMTHAGMYVYTPEDWGKYLKGFKKQYQLAFSPKFYEKQMVILKADPSYDMFRRAGLAIDVNKLYTDYEILSKVFEGTKGGKVLKYMNEMGERGFSVLKILRLQVAKNLYERMSSSLDKATPDEREYLRKEISAYVNHSTGASNVKFSASNKGTDYWLGTAFFAWRLEASRWNRIVNEPLKAIYSLRGSASDAEKAIGKMIFRRAGEQLATYSAMLALNNAILKWTHSEQRINFFHPLSYDWGLQKIGNRTFDMSAGVRSAFRLVGGLGYAMFGPLQIKNNQIVGRGDEATELLKNYIKGKTSPIVQFIMSGLTAENYNGNVRYWSGFFKPAIPSNKYQKIGTPADWIYSTISPLPIEEWHQIYTEGLQRIQDGMMGAGMKKAERDNMIGSAMLGTLIGLTGVRIGEAPKGETPIMRALKQSAENNNLKVIQDRIESESKILQLTKMAKAGDTKAVQDAYQKGEISVKGLKEMNKQFEPDWLKAFTSQRYTLENRMDAFTAAQTDEQRNIMGGFIQAAFNRIGKEKNNGNLTKQQSEYYQGLWGKWKQIVNDYVKSKVGKPETKERGIINKSFKK